MTDRIKFTVWRDKWLRGTGDGVLLNGSGCRCCLGFLGQALGCTDEEQRDVGLPQELDSASKWPRELVAFVDDDEDESAHFADAGPLDAIVGINDSKETDDVAREEQLSELFAKHGIDVEFRDSAEAVE